MLLLITFILFGILAFMSGAAYGKFSANVENFQAQVKKEYEKMDPKWI